MLATAAQNLQERKRQLDGAPKSTAHQQQPESAAAAARWGSTGGPTSAPKRQEGSHGSTAGAADDPIEVDDDEGKCI